MTDAEIIQRANAALAEEFELGLEQMLPEAHFKEDLGLDSLDAVDMIIALEKEFGIKIGKDPAIAAIHTLQDLHNYMICKKQSLTI